MNELNYLMIWLVIWCNQNCVSRINGDQDVYLFTINRSEMSDYNMLIRHETPNPNELELWNNQSYGDLVMSQKVSKEGNVPVWKFIDERLKDINLYVKAVEYVINDLFNWSSDEGSSGASGVLMLNKRTGSTDEVQLMYSWDTKLQRMVPIPKFIYKIVHADCHKNGQRYYAVIVIHNDPTASDGDCLDCERCYGWEEIENIWTYDEPGISYVCQLTKEVSKILRLYHYYNPESESLDYDRMPESPYYHRIPDALHLSFMPYIYQPHPEWTSLTSPWESGDNTYSIADQYARLKSNVSSDEPLSAHECSSFFK